MLHVKKQTIQILIPQKNCFPTLFINNGNKDHYKTKDYIIKKITLYNKNYFITFNQCQNTYNDFLNILKYNGLIRSNFHYGDNNLFLCPIEKNQFFNDTENIYNIHTYQKVYRFLNSEYLFQKSIFYSYYLSMKKLFQKDFDFMPETYNFPEEKKVIYRKFQNYTLNISDLWLIKPSNLSSGKNIKIFESLNEITLKSFVITKYITNVNLIYGRKYYLRLFILITGLKPLRIYFYKEGLVRIATNNYTLNLNSLKDDYIHLTNTKINYKNANYKHPNNFYDEKANLWSISMFRNFLKKENILWDEIREKIKDIIIKSLSCVYKQLIDEIKSKKVSDRNFYNLFGFDILIDDKYIPKLLEINKNPSMEITNFVNRNIKTKLLIDTLNLIGIIPYSRQNRKLIKRNRINSKINNINEPVCELKRPRGDYELIFPLKNNIDKYKKFFIGVSTENNEFWRKYKKILN